MTISAIAAVNDDTVFHKNLAASPAIVSGAIELIVERGHPSAAKAYNSGAAKAKGDLLVFAHQDIYFPKGWEIRLEQILRSFTKPWAVLGVIGCNSEGRLLGRASMTAFGLIGKPLEAPAEVVSIDEIVIILKRNGDLRFDEQLPGYHLYGTDIVQQALAAGLGAYAIDAPVVHNNKFVERLDPMYRAAFNYTKNKWRSRLPIPTPTLALTASSWPITIRNLRIKLNLLKHGRPVARHDDPAVLARPFELAFASNAA